MHPVREPDRKRRHRSSVPLPIPEALSERANARASQRLRLRRRRTGALLAVAAASLLLFVALGGAAGPRSSHTDRSATAPGAPHGSSSAHRSARERSTTLAAARDATSIAAILRYTNYVATGSRHTREVALTFDDGPSPFTPAILAILRRERARATFFEIGRAIRAYPTIARAVLAAGMPVGNHTQTHAFLGHLGDPAQSAELDAPAKALKDAKLPPTTLFRPPYGSFNAGTLSELHRRKLLMVLWSADTKDFSQPGIKRIVYIAVSGAKPGAIILMHDGGGNRSQTVAALPRIIRLLHQRGYRLVTVAQLLRDNPPPHGQRAPRNLAGH